MKVSRSETLRMIRFGPDDDRDKAPDLAWLQGQSVVQSIIQSTLSRRERQILKRVLKTK